MILALAFLVRAGWGLSRSDDPASLEALPDQREYVELATNLAAGRGLHFVDRRFQDSVWAFRTPGYPVFLAICGPELRPVRLAQAVLDTSTILAIYLLAKLLLPGLPDQRRRTALLASAIVAVNPFLVYFSGLLLSETLFTAMVAWGMVLLLCGMSGHRPGRPGVLALLGGLVLALSILVRPSATLLPVVMGVAGAFAARAVHREPPSTEKPVLWWWPLPVATTMLALTLLVIAPWAIRNHSRLGRWIWSTTNAGFTAFDGFNEDATGASNQSLLQRLPQLQDMSEVDRSDYLNQRAQQFAREHPDRAVMLGLFKIGRTWSPIPLSAEYGSLLHTIIGGAYAVPFFAATLIGLWLSPLARSAKVFLLAPAIYLTAVHSVSVGSLRYRIPAEPPMAVLAAAGLSGLGRRAVRPPAVGEPA